MPMQTTCASCQTRYTLPDTMQGKQVRCKKCGQSFVATPAPAAGPAPRASKLPKAPASPEPAASPPPAGTSGGRAIALVAVLLLAVMGAGGAWFFLVGPGGKNKEVAQGDTAAELTNDLAQDMAKQLPAEAPAPTSDDGKVVVPIPATGQPTVAVPDVGKLVDAGKAPPKPPDALPPATNVKITQQLYDRVQLGMTLEQAESILGKGKPITVNDLPPPLAGPTGAGPDKVRDAGQKCRVAQWYQWGTADLGIFAGFTKLGEGPERATVAAFRSAEKVNGVPVVNYPHKSDANPGPFKMPRPRIPGNYAEMIVGQWHERGHIKYDFRADGTYETKGGPKGTYKFSDNDTFELTPGGKRFVAFFAKDEMRIESVADLLDREIASTVSLFRVYPEQTAGIRTLPAVKQETLSLAFAPDSKTLVVGAGTNSARGEQGEIKLFDVATGAEKPFLKNPTHNLLSMALSADGKVLATGAWPSVKIWNVETAAEVRTIKVQGSNRVGLTADGKTLITEGNGVALYDVATGMQVQTFKFTAMLYALALSPDGKMAAWCNPHFYLGDVEAKKVVFHLKADTLGEMAFSPDGKVLAMSANIYGVIRLFDVGSKKSLSLLKGHLANVRSLAFTPDGRTLVSGGNDCTVKIWDVATGNVRGSYITYGSQVQRVAVSPDGKTVALANDGNGSVRLWDISNIAPPSAPAKPPAATVDAKPTPPAPPAVADAKPPAPVDAKPPVPAGPDVLIPDPKAPLAPRLAFKDLNFIKGVALSGDGKVLVAGTGLTDKGTFKAWEMSTGKEKVSLDFDAPVEHVAISPDGKTAAFNLHGFRENQQHVIKLLDVESGKELHAIKPEKFTFSMLAFAPDGKTLAAASFGYGNRNGVFTSVYAIRFYNVATGQQQAVLENIHDIHLRSMAFTPDGKTLVTCGHGEPVNYTSKPGEVKAWDLATGRSRLVFWGLPGNVSNAAVSSDGKLVAAGFFTAPYSEGEARLWDLQSGQELRRFDTGRKGPIRVAFSPDNKLLAVSTTGRKIHLLDVNTTKNYGGFTSDTDFSHPTFTPDGKRLVFRQSKAIEAWDLVAARPQPIPDDLANRPPPSYPATTTEPRPDHNAKTEVKPVPPPVTKTEPPKPPDPVTKMEPPAKPTPEDMKPFLGTWTGNAGGFPETWTFKDDNGQLAISAIYKRGEQVVGSWTGKDIKVAKGQVTFTEVWEKKPVRTWVSPMPVMVVPVGDQLKYSWGRNDYKDGSSMLSRAVAPAPAAGANDPLVGSWQWLPGGNRTVLADGTLIANGRAAGTWKLIDAGQRQYRLTWTFGFVDDLTLAADGNRLEGKNQKGEPVTARRLGPAAPATPPAKPDMTAKAPPLKDLLNIPLRIVNRGSGKGFGPFGKSTQDGAQFVQWGYQNGDVHMHYKLVPVENDWVTIENVHTGGLVSVTGDSSNNGAVIALWKKKEGPAFQFQQWKFVPVPGADGYYKIQNRASGKLIGVAAKATNDGARLLLWSDEPNAASEEFKLEKVDGR